MWYARKRHTEKLQGGMERDKLGILTNVFYKQREDFAKQQKEQEERFTFPEEVEEITDIVYIEDGKKEPQKITFGKIIKLTGLNRIPLKGM